MAGRLSITGQTVATIALDGNYAYIGETNGIAVVDVSNPASPTFVGTIGSGVFPNGSFPVDVSVSDGMLYVNASTSTNGSTFVVFSLADPANPALLGSADDAAPFDGGAGFVAQGDYAFISDLVVQLLCVRRHSDCTER